VLLVAIEHVPSTVAASAACQAEMERCVHPAAAAVAAAAVGMKT
jgi:hypothetical protein